ncbi:anti-sigma factor antagonist [Lentzea sp. NBRC 105346]|uniref:STAS domain-containing protein n=1 Tax=Lentzea sp. NBRC 105346 TaxID=3032205 RepID=UPI0024A223AC|nr:STAS domain-containing protein [Lentzea sp. NBRC 105346]GLZ34677.1 anti-sigma factor antagonist [Lentzea sp. NBRC 105346]
MTVQDPNVELTHDADPRPEQLIGITVRHQENGVTVLSVAGEVDMLSAPDLRTTVGRHLTDGATLVLDLSRVTFLGSAGLAVLVEASQQSKRRGVSLRVVAVARAVTRPLEATGLGDVFSVHRTVEEAVGA